MELEISPAFKRLTLDPGAEVEETLNVKNIGEAAGAFRVYATPYSTAEDNYSQDFATKTVYNQLARWITIDSGTIELEPGESKAVRLKINVPEDVATGGQYAAIIIEALPSEGADDMGINFVSQAAMLLYGRVSGETRREANLNNIKASYLAIGDNISVESTLRNTGNIDFQTSIEIVVSSVFGKELYRDEVIAAVLPESEKKVYVEWGETPFCGIYRLNYTINALNLTAEGNQTVLVVSPFFLGILVGAIILFVVGNRKLLRRRTDAAIRS